MVSSLILLIAFILAVNYYVTGDKFFLLLIPLFLLAFVGSRFYEAWILVYRENITSAKAARIKKLNRDIEIKKNKFLGVTDYYQTLDTTDEIDEIN